MSSSFKLAMNANQRVFVNGAVLRFDRKVGVEFLNDVTFLLDSYVLQPEQVTTPMRQLYFVIQSMLMDPANRDNSMNLYRSMLTSMLDAFSNPQILHGLKHADSQVQAQRDHDALKTLKQLFEIEAELLEQGSAEAKPAVHDTEVPGADAALKTGVEVS